jgi:hypothetical protein
MSRRVKGGTGHEWLVLPCAVLGGLGGGARGNFRGNKRQGTGFVLRRYRSTKLIGERRWDYRGKGFLA